jgi:uncharacterized protein YndB with AHSA1/START domain
MSDRFVYVTYIRTTTGKLWDALTKPEFTRAYWFGMTQETTWQPKSPWNLTATDGRVFDSGEVVEVDKPRRIVLRWRHELNPEMKAEGYSRCTFDIEPDGEIVKLTVTHEIDQTNSKFIGAVSGGWPKVLSSLKSLLESGHALPRTHEASKGA